MEDELDRQISEQISQGRQYTLMLLRKGPDWTPEGPDAALQRGHLRHLFALRNEGQLLLNGPVTDGGDIVGIGIFDDVDLETVRSLAEADPSVQAGRLRVDVRPWFGLSGDSI